MAELLLCEGGGISDYVPSRIVQQLVRQRRQKIRELESNTDNLILKHTLLHLDVDRRWERFSPALRRLLVTLLETIGTANGPVLVPDEVIHSILPGVPALRALKSPLFDSPFGDQPSSAVGDRAFVQTVMARVHLACLLANNVRLRAREVLPLATDTTEPSKLAIDDSKGIVWRFGHSPQDNIVKYVAQEHEVLLGPRLEPAAAKLNAIQRAWYYTRRMQLTLPRLTALCLTADPAFGRELYHGMEFIGGGPAGCLRPLLAAAYRAARGLHSGLTEAMLWAGRPYFWVLKHSIRGLNRTLYRYGGRLAMVERHKPFAELTGFLHQDHDSQGHAVDNTLHLNVYKGTLDKEFKGGRQPKGHKVIQWRAVYRGPGSRKHHKLLRMESRVVFKADGAHDHTDFYVYEDDSSRLPMYRITRSGSVASLFDFGDSRLHDDAAAVAAHGVLRAVYGPGGRVIEEVLQCTNRVSGKKVHVVAQYRHGAMDPDTVTEAMYRYRKAWSLVVLRWTRSETGQRVPTKRVQLVMCRNGDVAYLSRFSYLHPRHPVTTTTLLDVHMYLALEQSFGTPQGDQLVDQLSGSHRRAAVVETPPLVEDDVLGLIENDGFSSFVEDNLLYTEHMRTAGVAARCATNRVLMYQVGAFLFGCALVIGADLLLGRAFNFREAWVYGGALATGLLLSVAWPTQLAVRVTRYYTRPLPVHLARMMVWKLWRERKRLGTNFEAVHARTFDEQQLRTSAALRAYWKARDAGKVPLAQRMLERNNDAIAADLFMADSKSLRSHLHLRMPDLEACGSGGESRLVVTGRDLAAIERSSSHKLVVAVGLDSGTWPMDGGGVASCRRDLVDRIKSVRWFMSAEIGHELRTIKDAYQVERNVLSVQYIPLWCHNFGHLSQLMLDEPFASFQVKRLKTTTAVVRRFFLPLLSQLIHACAATNMERQDVADCTRMVINLYHYFQVFDWATTWRHPAVHERWSSLWTTIVEATPPDMLIDAEHPNLDDLQESLSFFVHFLTPLAIPLEESAFVVQATHHGIQALMGVVAKHVQGAAFVIWDHGILWRERLVALSSFKGASLFSRNTLTGLQRLCAFLTLHNADAIVPCTNIGNPGWEKWLAGGRGDAQRAAEALQRISPVVNGMETDRFHVDRTREEELPSAVMLSHVCDVKDVKNAIRAAGVIVNEFNISDYRLIVYGSITREPAYTAECQILISSLGVGANVTLEGLGNAAKVVGRGWIFLNSSKSEGLPLALGEAGLAGLPVVCTDVGGSREIVIDGHLTYGAIAPPGNPRALAVAQLRVLGMLGGLEEMVSDPKAWTGVPKASHTPSLADYAGEGGAKRLTKRMHKALPARRQLGMLYRSRVLRDFSMARYLREHEQILWIANDISLKRRGKTSRGLPLTSVFGAHHAVSAGEARHRSRPTTGTTSPRTRAKDSGAASVRTRSTRTTATVTGVDVRMSQRRDGGKKLRGRTETDHSSVVGGAQMTTAQRIERSMRKLNISSSQLATDDAPAASNTGRSQPGRTTVRSSAQSSTRKQQQAGTNSRASTKTPTRGPLQGRVTSVKSMRVVPTTRPRQGTRSTGRVSPSSARPLSIAERRAALSPAASPATSPRAGGGGTSGGAAAGGGARSPGRSTAGSSPRSFGDAISIFNTDLEPSSSDDSDDGGGGNNIGASAWLTARSGRRGRGTTSRSKPVTSSATSSKPSAPKQERQATPKRGEAPTVSTAATATSAGLVGTASSVRSLVSNSSHRSASYRRMRRQQRRADNTAKGKQVMP